MRPLLPTVLASVFLVSAALSRDAATSTSTGRLSIKGNQLALIRPSQPPLVVYRSDFNLRGALASPDGKLIAVVEGSGSAGDWALFLHRVEGASGTRYVVEPLNAAVESYIDFLYKLDPELEARPDRLRLKPKGVTAAGEFQFALSGDGDLAGRSLPLTIGENGKPLLFGDCDQ